MTAYGLQSSLSHGAIGAAFVLLLFASVHDVVARTVPNLMAIALAAASLLIGAMAGHMLSGVVAGTIIFLFAVFCWKRGWMGGGDVKLMGAAGFALTPAAVPLYLAAVSIAGGGIAMIYLFGRLFLKAPPSPRPGTFLSRVVRVERWRMSRGGPLPYACAIAAGTMFVLL